MWPRSIGNNECPYKCRTGGSCAQGRLARLWKSDVCTINARWPRYSLGDYPKSRPLLPSRVPHSVGCQLICFINQFFELDISELGDLRDDCLSTGSHFNPFNKVHGARTDSTRHVGDLGNIASDENGIATFLFTDNVISLNGPWSIIGYALFILDHGR